MHRVLWLAALAALGLVACASFSDRPSVQLVTAELDSSKKVVEFNSSLPVERLFAGIADNSCGEEFRTMSSMAVAGGAYVPVHSSMTFSKDHGGFSDGRKWIVLRGDGLIHAAVSGVVLTPTPDGSRVQVLVADKRKIELIRKMVEDGSVFCHWRTINYPYD